MPAPTAGCSASSPATFCDDFEIGPTDLTGSNPIWTMFTNGGGTAVIDSTHAFSGHYSYHASTPKAGGWAMITADVFPAGPVTAFWGRAQMFVATQPASGHNDYIVADSMLPTSTAFPSYMSGADWSISSGSDMLGTNIKLGENAVGPEWGSSFTTNVPVGAWTCYEWYFNDANQAAPILQIYLNGSNTPLDGSGDVPTDHSFQFRTLTIGVIQFDSGSGTGTYDYWYDDVAVGTTRIGCEAGKGF
jgi:hypothetical protein